MGAQNVPEVFVCSEENAVAEKGRVTAECKAACERLRSTILGEEVQKKDESCEAIDLKNIERAMNVAQSFVLDYIQRRDGQIHLPFLLGPLMGDATYFYRLGAIGTGEDLEQDELEAIKKRLLKQGFPIVIPEELHFINAINYFARVRNIPRKPMIIKHFPGGDEQLFATEEEPVHYSTSARLQGSLESFSEIFTSQFPPLGVMLSHATYDLKIFPEIEHFAELRQNSLHPWLRERKPSEIPASLNPIFVSYLKEGMDFQGLVVPDWYNMPPIEDFILANGLHFQNFRKFITLGYPTDATISILKVVFAVDAGVDFIPGIPWTDVKKFDWEAFQQESSEIYQRFSQKLDANLIHAFHVLKPAGSSLEFSPEKFSLRQKIHLITHEPLILKKEPESHYGEELKKVFPPDSDPYVKEVVRIFFESSPSIDNDIWNRSGMLVLMYRQKIIEDISSLKFANPPEPNSDAVFQNREEEKWFKELMKNQEFRRYYDGIDWNSPEMRIIYTQRRELLLKQYSEKK